MKRLTRPQVGFGGVLGDVFLKRPQLDFITDNVVIAVLLPEITAAIDGKIDLAGGLTLSAFR